MGSLDFFISTNGVVIKLLKNISPIISPDLLKCLSEMGHGDDIVIADANFPGAAMAQRLFRCDGIGIPMLLEAILEVFPLDDFVSHPASLMAVGNNDNEPKIWSEYKKIINRHEINALKNGFEEIERFEFYERAKTSYAIIQSGERELYANIILKKGVIHE